MPIDASIPLSVRPLALPDPLEQMQRIQAMQLQQQNAAALDEQRRAMAQQRQEQTERLARENQAHAAFNSAIQNGKGVRAASTDWANINAPDALPLLNDYFDKTEKNKLEISSLQSTIDEKTNQLNAARLDRMGHAADTALTYIGNDPTKTPAALALMASHYAEDFPQEKDQTLQVYQRMMAMPPDQQMQALQQMRASAPFYQTIQQKAAERGPLKVGAGETVLGPDNKPLYTAPQSPQDQMAAQQLAGMKNGLTPEQQVVNARALAAQAETVRHNAVSEAMADPTSDKNQQKLEQQYRQLLQREFTSRSGGLGVEDQKVNQAIHLIALMDQNKDAKGNYSIPRSQYAELASGLATLVSPNGRPTDSMRSEIEQRTARGDINGVLTYITGTPFTGSTQDIFKMLRESIERQGGVAENNRQGYFDALKAQAPTDLSDDRKAKLEQSLKLNTLGTSAAKPAASSSGKRVRVKGPNGESGTVPEGTPLPAGWSLVGG